MSDSVRGKRINPDSSPLADSLLGYLLATPQSGPERETPFSIGEWLATLTDEEVRRLGHAAQQAARRTGNFDEVSTIARMALSAETQKPLTDRQMLRMPESLVVVTLLEKKRRLGALELDAPLRIDPASTFKIRLLGNARR